MSIELYASLKEMYDSFLKEQNELEEKINENDNQYYNRIELLDSRIKTLGFILNFINSNNLLHKDCSENVEDFKALKNKSTFDKEDIRKRRQILDIQEKERQRIARDLHDTSLQNLAHLIHKVELSSLYMDEDIIKARLELESVNKNLKSIIQEIRNTIFDLRPMIFDDLGLKASFERLFSKMKKTSGLDIQYEIEEIGCENSLVLMNIFRIVEECMNNAMKHSKGSKIIFSLKHEEDNCLISVKDNGVGFDYNYVFSEKEGHFGMRILSERVDLLSGVINIDSNPGMGTTVYVVIPLSF